MKYPISVWLDYFNELPVEEAIVRLSRAGFTHGELSIVHLEQLMKKGNPAMTGKALLQCADSCGYAIPQGHLSFAGGLCDDLALERLKPELELFAEAKIGKAILHTNGGGTLSDEERSEIWAYYVRKLSEFVDGSGITICIENMFSIPLCSTARQIKRIINDAGGKNLAICLDTGHLNVLRIPFHDYIPILGKRILCVHIHDNNQNSDSHLMPYVGSIFWKDFLVELKKVGYSGDISFETSAQTSANRVPRELTPVFLRTFHAIAEYFRTQLQ